MKLKEYMEKHDITPTQFAHSINATTASLYYWMNGDRAPNLEHMIKIEEVTKGEVTIKDFERKKKLS